MYEVTAQVYVSQNEKRANPLKGRPLFLTQM